MKKILTVLILFVFSINFVNADEKKVKTRGKSQDKEFKKIEINISPDLLDLEEIKKLKKNFTTANNYAIELDKTLDEKKKIKFRGSAKEIYKNYSKSVFFLYNPDEKAMGTGFLVDDSVCPIGMLQKNNQHVCLDTPRGWGKSVKFLFEKQDYFVSVIATNKKKTCIN